MKKIYILLTMILCYSLGFGQSVKGIIKDTVENKPVQGATVTLQLLKDSTKKYSTLSDAKGFFEIKDISNDSFVLKITNVGYDNFRQKIFVDNNIKNLGTLQLSKVVKALGEVTIVAVAPPVTQKVDTVQYSASQFKVNPDATAEDMMKKLPGVTVDKSGTVTAQGEQVKKVTIDGRDFFGDDATAALRNLPAEIIDKIQVFDRLSDQAQFTGFDDGNTQKALNIVTKSNMRNGQFGRMYAGYGTDNRYAAGGNVSFFKNNRRISLVGLTNNINQQNFSSQDLLGVTSSGSNRGGFGGGNRGGGNRGGGNFGGQNNFLVGQQNGISKTNSFGINFSDQWGKKVTVSGSYFFNNNNTDNNQLTNRQTFLKGDSSLFYKENSLNSSKNFNNRINLRLEYKIDSNNSILITPSLSFQNYKSINNIDAVTAYNNNYNLSSLASSSNSDYNSKTKGFNIGNNILYRHSFAKRGRTISLGLNTSFNNKNGDAYLLANNTYYDAAVANDTTNQYTDNNTKGYTISGNIAYTEPVGKQGQLQLNYNPSFTKNNADQRIYQFDNNAGKYAALDTALSNKAANTYSSQNAGVSYRIGNRDKMFSIGTNFQYSTLESLQEFPVADNIKRNFFNVLPNLMLRKKLSATSSVNVFLRTSVNAPSINQLQDVVNNSNQLQYSTGNPDLKQQYTKSFITRYTFTNTKKGTSFFANLFLQNTDNYIANASYIPSTGDSVISNGVILKRGTTLTKPVNVNGYWSVRSFFTYGFPIKFIKSNVNVNAGLTYSKLPGLVNKIKNTSNNYTYNVGAVIASNVSEYVDFNLSYSANFNVINNTVQTAASNNYFNQVAGVQFNLLSKKGWFFQNDLNNQLYKGLSAGFNQNFWLWNVAIGKKILKAQAGEIKLSVFDLLKQNQSITRTSTESYIEDVQSQVLRQYFMLTFTYKLKNFGTPSRTNNNQNREQRMFF